MISFMVIFRGLAAGDTLCEPGESGGKPFLSFLQCLGPYPVWFKQGLQPLVPR